MSARHRGDLFSVPGLRGAAVKTGVKPSGAHDLALIVADEPMTAAGVFTTNRVVAAPVEVSRATLATNPMVRSIVINSGNANALTGAAGHAHAEQMRDVVADAAGGPALVYSTGVIGVPLPIERVLAGVKPCINALSASGGKVPEAILTTDTRAKRAAAVAQLEDGRTFTVGGVAKGSGMIHPNMATMLAFVATDAPVAAAELEAILRDAVDESFHSITVDGDTSTNDAVLLLAREPRSTRKALDVAGLESLRDAVTVVARSLAEQIVEDGEGATRVMELEIVGAPSRRDALAVGRAVASSSLVKTALAGGDPNWGRILAAAGTAAVPIDPATMTLDIGGHRVFAHGTPLPAPEQALHESFTRARVSVRLELGYGRGSARMLTTDLSKRYVEINSEYTT